MNKYKYSITVFDDDTYDVECRLGECQNYSDNISNQIITSKGIDPQRDQLSFFQVLKLLKSRKDLVVTFYGIKNNTLLHVYSDFFNLDGAFSHSFSFFDDLNSVIMLSENKETSVLVSFIKSGKILFQFNKNFDEKEHLKHNSWQHDYVKFYSMIDGMPSISDVETSIDFIIQNSYKSDSNMLKYLETTSLFKDKYII